MTETNGTVVEVDTVEANGTPKGGRRARAADDFAEFESKHVAKLKTSMSRESSKGEKITVSAAGSEPDLGKLFSASEVKYSREMEAVFGFTKAKRSGTLAPSVAESGVKKLGQR